MNNFIDENSHNGKCCNEAVDSLNTENLVEDQRSIRLKKLNNSKIKFRNDFKRDALCADIIADFNHKSQGELNIKNINKKIAGRIMLKRIMGNASFINIQDTSGRLQVYVRKDDLDGESAYNDFLDLDIGDIVGIDGFLFKTKTGELSIRAKVVVLLTKNLRPLPDKYHGLVDLELKYRNRYLDLIMNDRAKEVFIIRSKLIKYIRSFLDNLGYLEVETPMLHSIPGGALARPFITHHNALNLDLYLRIAPELYLKQLVIGGLEKVYEINRNFRNEGISTRHNPEFTTIEFYEAYSTYTDLMILTENLLRFLVEKIFNKTELIYQDVVYDFSKPFTKITLLDSILLYNPNLSHQDIINYDFLYTYMTKLGFEYESLKVNLEKDVLLSKMQVDLFESTVESKLIQPTYITDYPTPSSPLARPKTDNPMYVDRFELYIAGREIANGFSELNDPMIQAERFTEQAKAKAAGDLESMYYDSEYVKALEYGLPPTAGEGIGIDRLAMLFTNASSIRDVILFPLMKSKSN